MWVCTLVLRSIGAIEEETPTVITGLSCPRSPVNPPRDLFITVSGRDRYGKVVAYHSITAYAADLERRVCNLYTPTELTVAEQYRLRAWLMAHSISAWEQALPAVREAVGNG